MSIEEQTFTANFDFEVIETAESKDGKFGTVKALVSAYDVEYNMGFAYHKMLAGAFSDAVDSVIPVFWQHNWNFTEQPPIGTAVVAEEKRGVVVDASFFLDLEAGRAVYNAIKAKALREWSIGYRIREHKEIARDDAPPLWEISKAELFEASSVLKGANPKTDTLSVASEGMSADLAATVANLASTVADLLKLDERVAALEEAQGDFLGLQDRVSAIEDWASEINDVVTQTTVEVEVIEAEDDPATSGAGAGEEAVEPAQGTGGDDEAAGAAGGPSRAPDFLPPVEGEAAREDIESLLRVTRCMQNAAARAQRFGSQ